MPPSRFPPARRQVREALERARERGMAFDDAWPLAVHGEVCDTYESARVEANEGAPWPEVEAGAPPGQRASAGQQRCAGCRFLTEEGCGLYGVDVFAGVLWPARSDTRAEDLAALEDTVATWRAAYQGDPLPHVNWAPVLRLLDAVESGGVRMGAVEGGTLAA